MPTPTLPVGFKPLLANYSFKGPGGVVRTAIAGGPARYRLDYDKGQQQHSVTLVLDAGQHSAWVLFHTHTIQLGAVAFTMPLDSGFGTAAHLVNIVPGSYSASRTAGSVTAVSFTVETTSAAYALSDAAVAAYSLSASALPAGFSPTVSSYAITGAEGAMRSSTDGGAARYATDFLREPQQYSVTLVLSKADFARWTVWYYRLIKKGAYTFAAPLDSGFGPEPHACNILPDSYAATRNGLAWVVSIQIEATSTAYDWSDTDTATLLAMHALYSRDTDNLLLALARFATVDSLVLQTP